MPLPCESEITSAERKVSLLWVMLLGLRYRTANNGDLATISDLCDHLERGVPTCDHFNEDIGKLVAAVRDICLKPPAPDRTKAALLLSEVDRLERMLREDRNNAA